MQLHVAETGSSGLYCAVEEYTVSSPVLPLTVIELSRNPGIPVSRGNPSSCVRATGSSNTLSAQPDWKLLSVPGPNGRDFGTLVN